MICSSVNRLRFIRPSPSRVADSTYTWRSFRGSGHMLKVMCGDNVEYYDYLVRWIAYALKHPGKQGEVAIVLKGKEGTGKGTLAKIIMHLLGQHAMAIS